MKYALKAMFFAAPALLASPGLADSAPATQPSTQPQTVAQSNEPLVIPDGTSLQNPGPPAVLPNNQWQMKQEIQGGQAEFILGVRG